MRAPGRQSGFLIVVGAILIILGALIAAVVTFLFVTRTESGAWHLGSGQALFLAESGLERALRGYIPEDTWCPALGYTDALGAGNFSTAAAAYIARSQLTSAIAANDSVIPVAATASYAAHGRVRIENEDIDYAARSSACTPFAASACLVGAQRGRAGTTAAAHAVNVSVAQHQCLIASTGTVAATSARRVVERALQFPGAMVVYAKAAADAVPYYRLWDGSAWGPEGTAVQVGAGVQYLMVKFARTRNEGVLVTQDVNGNIRAQVWNGVSWGNQVDLVTTAKTEVRPFSVEYEPSSDRAVVVYSDGSTSGVLLFRTWNGSSWSAQGSSTISGLSAPRSLVTAPHPSRSSNQIVIIIQDSGKKVYGAYWTGTGWTSVSAGTELGVVKNEFSNSVNVAYEQRSNPGRALFVLASDVENGRVDYYTWDGTLSALGSTTDLVTDEIFWVRLVPDPYSNQMLLGIQDKVLGLYTRRWTGTAFDTAAQHPQHDVATEIDGVRNFDLVFETAPNRSGIGWLVWGNGGGAAGTVSVKSGQAVAGNWSWNAEAVQAGTDDTMLVQLAALPRSGSVLAALYQRFAQATDDDIQGMSLTLGSSTWSMGDPIWTGPTVAGTNFERVYIGVERYIPRVDWPEIYR